MSALADHLKRRILAEGPLSVADYMAESLGNPDFGYYRGADRLGRAGDFTTAPEISQMFGELVGLWSAVMWHAMGCPDPVMLIELGPGRGTLMADLLRAVRDIPGFVNAIRLHLVETSLGFRICQQERLASTNLVQPPSWHEAIDTVPAGPTILVANEFFDALPIRQFIKTKIDWRERLVDIDRQGGEFYFSLAEAGVDFELPSPGAAAAPVGTVFEMCPAALAIAERIGRRLNKAGGAALLLDYGPVGDSMGDTLQAVRNHQFHDVLCDPGEADLTAHVDFAALERALNPHGLAVYGPLDQGHFLERLGIRTRLDNLLVGATPAQATNLRAGYHRLVDPLGMGNLFKTMAFADKKIGLPPGFEV
jgi:NADH dehydrogenase [ubiquinone] 1 alpha subcomplex assembly factor 7